ncbi:hypothetical protein GNI_011240 [Gregarina niphandrodes]|uniref:Uncharacterized protein n=1 Tax=Gregarina niphandrodes TaxID=110365 RepID=A0A023BCP3_GRENI|nr:hypothetical protein GNI_011240 [Gregarina niphandrodes]EZG85909.1 hypothetical protein GNI_011240 [Gregarina niphandrodes]|eukprot:XP_011128803.1 hypothetical protein GNI_011240 [Gregarina niphandrodes]
MAAGFVSRLIEGYLREEEVWVPRVSAKIREDVMDMVESICEEVDPWCRRKRGPDCESCSGQWMCAAEILVEVFEPERLAKLLERHDVISPVDAERLGVSPLWRLACVLKTHLVYRQLRKIIHMLGVRLEELLGGRTTLYAFGLAGVRRLPRSEEARRLMIAASAFSNRLESGLSRGREHSLSHGSGTGFWLCMTGRAVVLTAAMRVALGPHWFAQLAALWRTAARAPPPEQLSDYGVVGCLLMRSRAVKDGVTLLSTFCGIPDKLLEQLPRSLFHTSPDGREFESALNLVTSWTKEILAIATVGAIAATRTPRTLGAVGSRHDVEHALFAEVPTDLLMARAVAPPVRLWDDVTASQAEPGPMQLVKKYLAEEATETVAAEITEAGRNEYFAKLKMFLTTLRNLVPSTPVGVNERHCVGLVGSCRWRWFSYVTALLKKIRCMGLQRRFDSELAHLLAPFRKRLEELKYGAMPLSAGVSDEWLLSCLLQRSTQALDPKLLLTNLEVSVSEGEQRCKEMLYCESFGKHYRKLPQSPARRRIVLAASLLWHLLCRAHYRPATRKKAKRQDPDFRHWNTATRVRLGVTTVLFHELGPEPFAKLASLWRQRTQAPPATILSDRCLIACLIRDVTFRSHEILAFCDRYNVPAAEFNNQRCAVIDENFDVMHQILYPADPLVIDDPEAIEDPENLVIDDDPEALVIDDDPAALVIDDDPEALVIDDDPAALVIDDDPAALVIDDDPAALVIDDPVVVAPRATTDLLQATIDEVTRRMRATELTRPGPSWPARRGRQKAGQKEARKLPGNATRKMKAGTEVPLNLNLSADPIAAANVPLKMAAAGFVTRVIARCLAAEEAEARESLQQARKAWIAAATAATVCRVNEAAERWGELRQDLLAVQDKNPDPIPDPTPNPVPGGVLGLGRPAGPQEEFMTSVEDCFATSAYRKEAVHCEACAWPLVLVGTMACARFEQKRLAGLLDRYDVEALRFRDPRAPLVSAGSAAWRFACMLKTRLYYGKRATVATRVGLHPEEEFRGRDRLYAFGLDGLQRLPRSEESRRLVLAASFVSHWLYTGFHSAPPTGRTWRSLSQRAMLVASAVKIGLGPELFAELAALWRSIARAPPTGELSDLAVVGCLLKATRLVQTKICALSTLCGVPDHFLDSASKRLVDTTPDGREFESALRRIGAWTRELLALNVAGALGASGLDADSAAPEPDADDPTGATPKKRAATRKKRATPDSEPLGSIPSSVTEVEFVKRAPAALLRARRDASSGVVRDSETRETPVVAELIREYVSAEAGPRFEESAFRFLSKRGPWLMRWLNRFLDRPDRERTRLLARRPTAPPVFSSCGWKWAWLAGSLCEALRRAGLQAPFTRLRHRLVASYEVKERAWVLPHEDSAPAGAADSDSAPAGEDSAPAGEDSAPAGEDSAPAGEDVSCGSELSVFPEMSDEWVLGCLLQRKARSYRTVRLFSSLGVKDSDALDCRGMLYYDGVGANFRQLPCASDARTCVLAASQLSEWLRKAAQPRRRVGSCFGVESLGTENRCRWCQLTSSRLALTVVFHRVLGDAVFGRVATFWRKRSGAPPRILLSDRCLVGCLLQGIVIPPRTLEAFFNEHNVPLTHLTDHTCAALDKNFDTMQRLLYPNQHDLSTPAPTPAPTRIPTAAPDPRPEAERQKRRTDVSAEQSQLPLKKRALARCLSD